MVTNHTAHKDDKKKEKDREKDREREKKHKRRHRSGSSDEVGTDKDRDDKDDAKKSRRHGTVHKKTSRKVGVFLDFVWDRVSGEVLVACQYYACCC
jgi:pre-mRNA-processing factor 40